MGEGLVDYEGNRYEAREVFKRLHLKPIRFYAKDGLAVISSNAVSFSRLSLLIPKIKNLLYWFDLACSLSLEALGGNITPLDDLVVKAKHHNGQNISSQHFQSALRELFIK